VQVNESMSFVHRFPSLKVCFMPHCFYERPTLVPVFANRKKSKENLHLYETVIVSSLCAISAHGRFHKNALLSDSGGHLYTRSLEGSVYITNAVYFL